MANMKSFDIGAQFQNLNGRHPGQWPLLPRVLCGVGVLLAVLALGWYFYWDGQLEELSMGEQEEQRLREAYKSKVQQAVNLEALRKQKEQVGEYVATLEKQLPSKAEMDALLSDINQAGLGRGLQFELFKPGQVVVKEYYAELPIDIKITGNYHDVGAFTSDVANLPRINPECARAAVRSAAQSACRLRRRRHGRSEAMDGRDPPPDAGGSSQAYRAQEIHAVYLRRQECGRPVQSGQVRQRDGSPGSIGQPFPAQYGPTARTTGNISPG
ncbi:MAG: hypothetical protein EOO80_12050 [Oxalobacteraceae bacterium]|nr:MAG: hypothetical protein EOO80_12050 [Oxalobacteraceae bacterium]